MHAASYAKKHKAGQTAGDGKKKTKAGVSGKEGSKDVPSCAKGERPNVDEDGKKSADRLLGDKYGSGGYSKGPNSEWNKIRKWGDRSFE